MRKLGWLTILGFCVFATPLAQAAGTIFTDRAAFEAECTAGTFLDNYEDPLYEHGDITDLPTLDIWSMAGMDAVKGETSYASTFFSPPNFSFVTGTVGVDRAYCSGCNGTFRLILTGTSLGTAEGVHCLGFDVDSHALGTFQRHAFVTYGDLTTEDFLIPGAPSFWGIVSPDRLNNVHIGLAAGGTTSSGSFVMDNLTIGGIEPIDPGPGDEDNGKVTICHIPPGHPEGAHTIVVGAAAVDAHLAHGDTLGPCPCP